MIIKANTNSKPSGYVIQESKDNKIGIEFSSVNADFQHADFSASV